MSIKTIYILILFLAILLPTLAKGQISEGGVPIEIQKLKSASPDEDWIIMPPVDNQKMRMMNNETEGNHLKSLRFAYSFPVSLTMKNSGKWYNTTQVNVWQLHIRSSGAYSLNLILEHFKLPEHARLFLISMKTGQVKGAYTSANNSDSGIFAIEPVDGDEMLVQYEEPVNATFPGEFQITKVSHDFVGITYKDHRPLGVSGTCNVNVNCDVANGSENIRDAVCRIIIDGIDICSGTMINNTALDGSPYVLTAFHCFIDGNIPSAPELEQKAQASVFLFNYEAPYCSYYNSPAIDGDVSRSLSGSSMKASFDSLDFALLRLNTIPPYNYRTYLAGWNRINLPPTSSMSIHHPWGDIKKVSIDLDAAKTKQFESGYLPNGCWNILTWEYGVTERGSSGGGLFDQNKQLIGYLSGGASNCTNRKDDYFSKFALSWDHRKETDKQLKYWLDPLNSNINKLSGVYSGSGKTLCKPYTNFKNSETQAIIPITSGLTKKGYWSGTNNAGFTDFAEKFTFSRNCEIQGITLGIAKMKINPLNTNPTIDVQVYQGKDNPETLIYTEKFDISKFTVDAMNYLSFKNTVKTVGNFFVSYNISQLQQGDSLVVYMANRKSDTTNSFYLKNQTGWSKYSAYNSLGNGSALLFELIACNIDDPTGIEFNTDIPGARFFPNPLTGNSVLTVQTVDSIDCEEEIVVYDLLGKKQDVQYNLSGANSLSMVFAGKKPGIYMVHLYAGGRTIIGKVAYVP